MPYIENNRRAVIADGYINPESAGELNFLLTTIILDYLGSQPNYQLYNDVMGALEGVKFELYRRSIAPYEDSKILQNGDLRYPWKDSL